MIKNLYRISAAAQALGIPRTTAQSALRSGRVKYRTTGCGLDLVTLRDLAKPFGINVDIQLAKLGGHIMADIREAMEKLILEGERTTHINGFRTKDLFSVSKAIGDYHAAATTYEDMTQVIAQARANKLRDHKLTR